MGPSGSGKTTLLDILSGRKTQGKVEGVLQFGGQTPSAAFLKRYTGQRAQRGPPPSGAAAGSHSALAAAPAAPDAPAAPTCAAPAASDDMPRSRRRCLPPP